MSFNIYPKEIKKLTTFALAENAKLTVNGEIDPKKKKLLEFENDSIAFDPEKFGKLIDKMERQKSAYALQNAAESASKIKDDA